MAAFASSRVHNLQLPHHREFARYTTYTNALNYQFKQQICISTNDTNIDQLVDAELT